MCRVKFGLTGIYFDSLEPSRRREDFFQPLTASVPLVLQDKQGEAVPEAINGGENKEGVVVTAEIPNSDQDRTTKDLSSSSSSSRDEGCRWAKKEKKNHASVGSKRVRNPIPSSSSSASSSSASSPPSSDEERFQKVANGETDLRTPEPSKLINSRTTQKPNVKPYNCPTSTSLGKAPPAKSVRFAMDVQESVTLSDDTGGMSSSHSSDDSYTDPPSPTEPYDAFGGYYRTTGASRSRNMNGQVAEWGMRMQAGVKNDLDGYDGCDGFDGFDGFHDSEDGSEVDVQALPVRRRPPRTVQATAKGLTSDRQHHQNSSIPAAWSKPSGRVTDPSRPVSGDPESNVDNGLHLGEAHASQKQPVVPPKSREQSGYPKLRSGKDLPEPIFVVRPKYLSDAKEKGKPAGRLSNSGYGKDHPKDVQETTKTSPPHPTLKKAPKENPPPKYRHLSVTEELKRDNGFD